MEKISFQKHIGSLDIRDNSVNFYGVRFKNIILAAKSLKDLVFGEVYYMWYYNYHTGFLNDKTKQIYIDNRWLPGEDFAENYIDTKKIK